MFWILDSAKHMTGSRAPIARVARVLVSQPPHARNWSRLSGRNTVEAFAGIGIEHRRREMMAIIGPSCSGKSTLKHISPTIRRVSEGSSILDQARPN